jgi:hypothetical protein
LRFLFFESPYIIESFLYSIIACTIFGKGLRTRKLIVGPLRDPRSKIERDDLRRPIDGECVDLDLEAGWPFDIKPATIPKEI